MNTTKNSAHPIVISTESVLAAQLFSVEEWHIQFPNGTTKTHEVVHRDPTITVFPLTDTYDVYLVKQYRYFFKTITLEAMAGFVDKNENPLSAAKRELAEETGLVANQWKKLIDFDVATSVVNAHNYLFIARDLTQKEARPEEDEDITVVKMSLQEAYHKVITGEIHHCSSIIGILKIHDMVQQKLL